MALLGKPDKAKAVAPDFPPFPWALDGLWEMFIEVSLGIGSNGMSVPVITWQDIEAFDRASGHELSAWEKRALVRLGNLRAVILSEEKPKAKPGGGQNKNRSNRPRH